LALATSYHSSVQQARFKVPQATSEALVALDSTPETDLCGGTRALEIGLWKQCERVGAEYDTWVSVASLKWILEELGAGVSQTGAKLKAEVDYCATTTIGHSCSPTAADYLTSTEPRWFADLKKSPTTATVYLHVTPQDGTCVAKLTS
jgi:hypothetical protein